MKRDKAIVSIRQLVSELSKPYQILTLIDSILAYLPEMEKEYDKVVEKIQKLTPEQRQDKLMMSRICGKLYAESIIALRRHMSKIENS